MKSKETRYPDYPLFKGLQRPLEVMGLQGRYIYWAAGTAGGAIAGFIAVHLPCRIRGRAGRADSHSVGGHRANHLQAAERSAQQENGPRRVRLCLLA